MKSFKKLQISLTLVLLLFVLSCSEREISSDKLQERNGIYYAVNEEDPYSGIVIDKYKDGQIDWKKSYKDGILDGKYESWYSNGQKEFEKEYSKGKPDGVFIKWTKEGQKISEISYEDSVLSGSYNTWHDNGQSKEKGFYDSGKQDGSWSYWEENGKKTIELQFEDGRLEFLTREGKKVVFGELKDADGNVYSTIKIGNQEWMAENLKVTHYRNGDPIPNVTNAKEWSNLKDGAYCAYDNNTANIEPYGLLYNWYAVDDKRNIAPQGWRVPTDEDWKGLEEYLGNQAGSKLKATGGWYSNGNGTNESGFSALPGGYRGYDGAFRDIGSYGYWWSATAYGSIYAWFRYLGYGSSDVYRYLEFHGFSVRLVRD